MKIQIASLLVIGSIFVAPVMGDPRPTPTFPPSGVLSETTTSGYGSAQVELPWAQEVTTSGTQSPLTGTVFKKSAREWIAKVFNNSSTDTFSASIKIIQKNVAGSSVKTDSFSVTLKPRESSERPISGSLNAANASLELVSWKKLKSTAPKS